MVILLSIQIKHTWYLSFFLHKHNFWFNFSPHKKRVNRDKTDFATKQRKLRQNRFCNKKMLVCSCGEVCHVETFLHMTDFSTFLCITHFAPHLSCGELSLCDRFFSHFSRGETSLHDNLSYGKISPHDRFFLHKHCLWCLWQISGMIQTCAKSAGPDHLTWLIERESADLKVK